MPAATWDYFRYKHQLEDRNNQRYAPISLERTRVAKFWNDHNFDWYLVMSEVNTALASYHFKDDVVVQTSLDFWIALTIEYLNNTIGVEFGDN